MASTLVSIALLAVAPALARLSTANSPCISSDFSLAMRVGVGDNFVSLSAIGNGTDGTAFIVGVSPIDQPGTPFILRGVSGSATLEFKVSYDSSSPHDIEEGTYGVYVPDLGESYGTAVPITGTIGQEWPHFYYAEDYVDPQRTAASQQWYACNETIQGDTYLALNWGVYNSNGSFPWGCSPTTVKRVFNIPCCVE